MVDMTTLVDSGFDKSACGLLTLDADGVMLRANTTFCTWLGYTRAEIEGLPFERFLTMGGRVFSQTHWAPLMQMQGSVAELKLSLIHKDGHRIPVLINASRHQQDGRVLDELGVMIVAQRHSYERELLSAKKIAAQALGDIKSEQVARSEAEERLRVLNLALVEANRFKDDFLATLAHELRNPLAPMRNAAEILKKTSQEGLHVRLSGIFDRQVRHMTRLVDDLSDISRITQGKIELRRSLVNLNELLLNAVDTVRATMDSASHALIVQICDETLFLDADPTRVLQVVVNLLNNSVKYTPAGGKVWLSVQRDIHEARLSVRDTGIGIAPEDIATIFGMFSQLTPGLDRSQGGLGIGLALVRALVELHGGSVSASSAGTGLGSEFIVRLPLVKTYAETKHKTLAAKISRVTPRRVLIVDDNEDAASSLEMMLQIDGHEVFICRDGESALQKAEELLPDVVLLDIELPGIDGYEVAKRLRIANWNEPILVAITGWGRDQDKQAATDAGFDHHFLKPMDIDALIALLSW